MMDKTELRGKIAKLYVGSSQRIGMIVADRILVIIAPEQIRKEERKRIIKDLHSIEFESNSATDFLNKTMYYVRQALSQEK